ncbi:MAG TPA: M3 family metallopeptidase [Trueperaceae bacterium]|nr:M3 family metallopeptidase [Trueperaceae bacterium]
MAEQPARSDVPVDQTWNLTDLFPSRDAWLLACDAIRGDIASVTLHRGRVCESAETLLGALTAYEGLTARLRRVSAYATLRTAVEQTDTARQADAVRASQLVSEVDGETTFLTDELLALGAAAAERLLAADPRLEPFRRLVERTLREQPYRLAPETERVLASFSEAFEAPHTIYQRATGADVRFEAASDEGGRAHPVTMGRQMFTFGPSPDTRLRREAYRSVAQGFTPYRHTLATSLATFVRNGVVEAQLRGFPSAIDMGLHRQEVTREAFDRILQTIGRGVAPHMRRYAGIQRRVLGLDRVRVADIDAGWPDAADPLSFDEARDLILEAAAPMGGAYRGVLQRAFAERWIDRADNAGRRGGAFCSSVHGVHPYVFVTWTGGLRGAFILAHELGHAVQGQLAMEHNPLTRSRPSLFAIEAPSTFNELLLARHLLERSHDPAVRRRVIKTHMATFNRNFVVHLQKALLQRRIYHLAEAGEPITAEVLDREELSVLDGFWGDSVELIDEDRSIWMHEAHYYMGMYPYTYAAGLSAAVAMFAQFVEDGAPAAERWLAFLKAGGSAGPLELFARAGVDMTAPETLQRAVDHVGALVDELEGEGAA